MKNEPIQLDVLIKNILTGCAPEPVKEILTPTGEKIIAIEVPDTSFEFKTEYEDKYTMLFYKDAEKPDNNPYSVEPTFEDWHYGGVICETSRKTGIPKFDIVGMTGNLTDSKVEMFIDKPYDSNYKDYLLFRGHLENVCENAVDSFMSFLSSSGLTLETNVYLILRKT